MVHPSRQSACDEDGDVFVCAKRRNHERDITHDLSTTHERHRAAYSTGVASLRLARRQVEGIVGLAHQRSSAQAHQHSHLHGVSSVRLTVRSFLSIALASSQCAMSRLVRIAPPTIFEGVEAAARLDRLELVSDALEALDDLRSCSGRRSGAGRGVDTAASISA